VRADRQATSYSPQLDGLRAVAVAAVAYSHWLPEFQFGLPLGAGVHLFFVLSGFLITRILLGLRDADDRPRAIARFYVRRALRLFPAFYVVLALAALAGVPLVRDTWPWHASYLSNVFIASREAWQGHVSHFWSLAVEEQFYLVWPWFIVWAPGRSLVPIVIATILVGPAAHIVAATRGLGEPFWALVPGGSADSLGVGALVALTAWHGRGRAEIDRAWGTGALAGGAGWLGLAAVEWSGATLPLALGAVRQLLQASVFAWVVYRGVDGFRGLAGRVLAHPVVVWIGAVSYGVYLLHAFAPLVVDACVRAVGGSTDTWSVWWRAGAAWTATLALAAVLWRVVEAPWHRLKARVG
jgi:peptidoglycan/LPS O-acetylase OafA/YrhL